MTRTFSAVALAFGAAGLLATGCTSSKQDAPPASGPSELSTSITMYASPDTLRQDGVSQSQIIVQARDANGQAMKNVPIRLEIAVAGTIADFGQLSGKNVYTGSDGRASAMYTSPMPPADAVDSQTVVQVLATPVGSDYGNAMSHAVSIRLVPPGMILPPNGTPVPSFVFSPSAPLTHADLTFDASSSTDSDGVIASYAWNFGDGSTATGALVQHQYSTGGSYTVVLTVTDDRGLSASKSQPVAVSDASTPKPAFTFSPEAPALNQEISFNGSESTAAPGRRIVRYDWDFGSGTPISGRVVSKSYDVAGKYTVTLVVTDDADKKGATSKTVTIGAGGMTAAFTYSPKTPLADETVYFDASPSTSLHGIASYRWDFGDGLPGGNAVNITHQYVSTGPGAPCVAGGTTDRTFVVRLFVTDVLGTTATTTQDVTMKNCGT